MSNVPTEAQSMSDVSRSQCSHLHTALPLAVGREEPLYTTHCSSLSTLFVNYIVKFIILSFLIFIYSLNKPSMTAKSTLLIKTMQAGSRLITIFPNVTITFQNVTTAQSRAFNWTNQCCSASAEQLCSLQPSAQSQRVRIRQRGPSTHLLIYIYGHFTHTYSQKFSIVYSFFDKNELFHASTVCRGHHKYTRELAYTISWQRSNFPAATLLLFGIKPK